MSENLRTTADTETEVSACCPVCTNSDVEILRTLFDDRFGHPEEFHLARCIHCGHLMTHPRLHESELADLYGTFYPREKILASDVVAQAKQVTSSFARQRRWWQGTDNQGQYNVRPGDRMLDIGCGSGVSLLSAQLLGAQAWGIEADPNVGRLAQELGLAIHQGSLHDQPFADVDFDLIVLNQVVEHIPEPDKALLEIKGRLAPGGRVLLVFPNIGSLWCRLSGPRWINWHVPYHQHHFTLASFTRMAMRCGFRVARFRTITPNGWTLLQIRASRQSIVRGEVNPMWRVKAPSRIADNFAPESLVAWRKILRVPVLMLVGIFNRIIDSAGFGDSLLVELRPDNSERKK